MIRNISSSTSDKKLTQSRRELELSNNSSIMTVDTKQQSSIRHKQNKTKTEQIIGTIFELAVILLLVDLLVHFVWGLFVNLKEWGEETKEVRTVTIFWREVPKCSFLKATGQIVLALMMCLRALNRENISDSCCMSFRTHPWGLPLPDPSWPHRWTFEKQSLESVPSNGFIKEVIILQRGGAVNGGSNDVFHYPTLTKLFIQGLTEYLQFSFFKEEKSFLSLFFSHLH